MFIIILIIYVILNMKKYNGLTAFPSPYVTTYERHCILSHLHNEKSNIDGSSESTQHVDSTSSVILSVYRCIFFLHVLIISVVLDPTYGQSGFQSVDGRNNSNHITRALICRVTHWPVPKRATNNKRTNR